MLHFDMDMEPENDWVWKSKEGLTFDLEQGPTVRPSALSVGRDVYIHQHVLPLHPLNPYVAMGGNSISPSLMYPTYHAIDRYKRWNALEISAIAAQKFDCFFLKVAENVVETVVVHVAENVA
ncbi:hypothetical protein ACSBR2_038127 [Camellia fascicularis]